MNRIRTALSAVALIAIVIAAVAGQIGAAPRVEAKWDGSPAVAAPQLALSAVTVIARKPTVSEILDIILNDRPESRGDSFAAGSDESHVARVLRDYTSDEKRAGRIAAALVREGRRKNVGLTLLLGVMLTENPWLDPRATSFVGARGLMQVMPFHAGKWGCGSGDLFDIESNICHGVAILADNLKGSKTLPEALLGYNGCVRGTNTPDCWRYPGTVFRHARNSAMKGGGTIPSGMMPFSYQATAPRRVSRGAQTVRRGNIMLPRELLVD